jgi:NAD(P)H-hydrate epimerase
MVSKMAREYKCVILFKQITDIITDGEIVSVVTGGNAGLTKGGTGDVLAGITAALYTKSAPDYSALVASYVLKKTAEDLFLTAGLLYNTSDLIRQLPFSAKPILFDN